jgi:signal transduction histidine kinase
MMVSMEKREAAFMGRITANATHEMKNVLAIIKEYAGLLQDILARSDKNSIPSSEKMTRSIESIRGQVQRGVELTEHLNRFAHSPDETIGTFELNLTVSQIVYLSRRLAGLKEISLEAAQQNQAITIVSDPLKAQMLIFQCIDVLLDVVESGATMRLKAVQLEPGTAGVEFTADKVSAEARRRLGDLAGSPQWSSLEELAGTVEGSVQLGLEEALMRLVLPVDAGHRT